MSPLRMGAKRIVAPTYEAVVAQSHALATALDLGGPQLDVRAATAAREIVAKTGARVALSGDHTVVALAGATGSGKSSLFNALAGADLATIGARRPTTATPSAAVWGPDPAGGLLDWLEVSQRHVVAGASGDEAVVGALDGLVLLDLPDVDSRVDRHRAEAERVLGLCDVFVWVTDPQKYADATLHDHYVRKLAGYEGVMLAVLNQVDLLDDDGVAACLADLRRLLEDDGVPIAQVLATSARSGAGLPVLRQRLANAVAGHAAGRQRLSADLTAAARKLREGVADTEPLLDPAADGRLEAALARAAGVPVVLQAVEDDYRRESLARTGWIFTRWGRKIKPDPLGRLRLDKSSVLTEVDVSDVRAVLGRSSIPAPSPAARSAVRLATRELTDRASAGLPVPWALAVADVAEPEEDRLDQALDRAVVGTSLRARSPRWWPVLGVLQWALGVAAVLGLVWLVVLGVLGWLQLPRVDTPSLGPFAVPFLLLVAGLLLGVGLAALSRAATRRGAVRRRNLIAGRLDEAIGVVADERLVAPVRAVLERHRDVRTSLEQAVRA
ncbi:GTPase [Lapillicoccus sp.]|uniref:GTPase n=1 Tax=Lapillicoccus sp. TaxID=1909287 RepID=UPI0025DDB694|nr:GTPase [Lapillicoccus sp.]